MKRIIAGKEISDEQVLKWADEMGLGHPPERILEVLDVMEALKLTEEQVISAGNVIQNAQQEG